MNPPPDRAAQLGEQLRTATAIADRAVVCLIECEGIRLEQPGGAVWYDTAPMVDPREQPPQAIDINTEELRYAELRGLIQRDPLHPHLVRVQHNRNTSA
jgi:hypothetical protein